MIHYPKFKQAYFLLTNNIEFLGSYQDNKIKIERKCEITQIGYNLIWILKVEELYIYGMVE
ncbi:hypothetical protein CH362_18355 [Leptospira saintgironsiae]|uniref:Uncharacterized protein n=1 Tax=Leptospira saintgironsiae TaxID=2023183 RepID=A0A2M9Y7V9_9LEPT|nr:hypothetical protein CH362_18355 [Leptospira saintgironsiae]